MSYVSSSKSKWYCSPTHNSYQCSTNYRGMGHTQCQITYFRVSLIPGPLPSDFIKSGSGLGMRLVQDQGKLLFMTFLCYSTTCKKSQQQATFLHMSFSHPWSLYPGDIDLASPIPVITIMFRMRRQRRRLHFNILLKSLVGECMTQK